MNLFQAFQNLTNMSVFLSFKTETEASRVSQEKHIISLGFLTNMTHHRYNYENLFNISSISKTAYLSSIKEANRIS